jgi:predicted TIM-barrel fold metal-dependent hydrolase
MVSMPAAETRSGRGTRAPDGTVDTHIHIYGPAERYPVAPTARVQAVAGASLPAYRTLMERPPFARCQHWQVGPQRSCAPRVELTLRHPRFIRP